MVHDEDRAEKLEAYEVLEDRFGRWIGNYNTVACNTGSAALYLALTALQIPKGSSVIVPEYTFVASARAVTLASLKPMFADCDSRLLMDLSDWYPGYADGYGAVMPVHVYGRQVDIAALHAFGRGKLPIIEDMAEAHGVMPHPDSAAACWSFNKTKIVHGEEGGMVAFKDAKHAARARLLRSQGAIESRDWMHIPGGINARLTNACARQILFSLEDVQSNLEDREQIAAWYNMACPPEWRMPPRDVNWVYDLRIPRLTFARQDSIVKRLHAQGIAARHGFKPMSMQPEYATDYGHLAAYRAAQEIVCLPITPGMSRADVDRNVNQLIGAYGSAIKNITAVAVL